MKCDELKRIESDRADIVLSCYQDVYEADSVDAAIAELKTENQSLKKKMDDYHLMSDIRRAKIKELKRALWLARAKRATEKADSFIDIKITYNGVCNIEHSVYPQKNAKRMLTCDEWQDVWTNVWDKCRAKAEEYK